MKKIYLLVMSFMLLFSSTYASQNASFFGGDPVVNNWDASLGTGTIDFSVDTANSNTISADVQLIYNGGLIDSQQFTGLGARDPVQYTINIPLNSPPNKNGVYTWYVELRNEQDLNEFDSGSFAQGTVGTYTGGNPLEDVYYLFGTPAPTGLDSNAGTFSFDWYIGSDTGLTDIQTTVELINDVAGIVDTQTFTGLSQGSYNAISYDFTTLGNYNGVYTVRVFSESAGNTLLNNEVILNAFDYQNGVVYQAPAPPVESSSGLAKIIDIIPSLFGALATLIAGAVNLITGDLLFLTIMAAFVSLFVGVIFLVKKYVTDVTSKGTKK